MKYLILFITLFSFSYLSAQDIYKNLVAYYPMNCNALDSSGNNINGTEFGNLQCIEGKLFEALKFNGIDDYIDIPKSESNRLISSNGFTWSLWVRSSNIPQSSQPGRSRTFISAASPADAEDIYIGFGSISTARNEVAFVVDGPGGAGASAAANNAILNWKPDESFQNDEWYHIVGIRDYTNNNVKLYVNGALVDEASFPSNNPFVNPLDFSIGRFSDGSSDIGSYYDGNIDEIRIYDRVITEQEILILYSARPEQIEVETEFIEFSNIECRADSVIFVDLLNVGPSDFIISETELKIGNEFSILNGGEIFLTDQETYTLGIKFEPTQEGDYYDTLYLRNNFGVQPLIIYLSASKFVDIKIQDTLRFVEIVDCSDEDSKVAKLKIYNNNITDGLDISNIEFSDKFSTSNTFSKIPINDSLEIDITYSPIDYEFIDETATVHFNNCDQSRTFTILARYTKLDSEFEPEIDFGRVENGVLESRTYTIKNTGTTRFDINFVEFENNTEFTLLTDPNDFVLPVAREDSVDIIIGFTPNGGETSDSMYIISYSLCGEKIDTIPLFGNGRYRANIDIKIEQVQASLNDKISVPITITNINNLELAEIDSIKIDYEVNATSLVLDEDETDRNAYFKTYSKTFAISSDSEQIHNLFDADVVLGNSSNPEISIRSVQAIDGLLNYTAQNSNVEIIDICEAGELKRLFMSSFWFSVDEPSPNPANNYFNLNFELIEEGQTNILLFDQQGNLVKELINMQMEPGIYETKFDVNDLNQGVYFINLITPSHNVTKKLIKQ